MNARNDMGYRTFTLLVQGVSVCTVLTLFTVEARCVVLTLQTLACPEALLRVVATLARFTRAAHAVRGAHALPSGHVTNFVWTSTATRCVYKRKMGLNSFFFTLLCSRSRCLCAVRGGDKRYSRVHPWSVRL